MEGAFLFAAFGTASLLGLAFGAGPCNVACMPFLGPVFLTGFGNVRPRRAIILFSLGRLTGYIGIAAAAGMAGNQLLWFTKSPVPGLVAGGAAFMLGSLMLVRKHSGCRANVCIKREPPALAAKGSRAPLFVLGLGMALNPCTALSTILVAAASMASAFRGALVGAGFGIGAVVIPAAVFGLLTPYVGRELRAGAGRLYSRLETAGYSLLALLGLATAAGWVKM